MILVTGASGQLGSSILRHLQELGVEAVGGSRTPDEAGRSIDFDDPDSLNFRDFSTVVLVSAGYAEDDVVVARHRNVLQAASRDGVKHVIYTSLVSQGDHLAFALAHRVTEQMVRESGLDWTILRNGLYAELIGGLMSWEGDAILSPFGSGAVSAPTREELAIAAAIVAAQPGNHASRCYDLTGPAFTVDEIAVQLNVSVTELTLAEYRNRLLATQALLPFQPPMLASIATSIRHGLLSEHSGDLAGLLGRDPSPGLATAADAATQSRKSSDG